MVDHFELRLRFGQCKLLSPISIVRKLLSVEQVIVCLAILRKVVANKAQQGNHKRAGRWKTVSFCWDSTVRAIRRLVDAVYRHFFPFCIFAIGEIIN